MTQTRLDIEVKGAVQFVSAGELLRNPRQTDWLIRKILQVDSMNTIIGAPGAFKSNIAIDIAASVATGIAWHGRPAKRGAVFVIAGEGHSGLARRLKAWSIVRGADLSNAPLFVSMGAVGLVNPLNAAAVSEEVDRLTVQTGLQPLLVIVDTLARNFGAGDENSASDMGRFILNLDTHIRQRFKCAVLIVHHAGIADASRARGSSALFAAVDTEIVCQRDGQERTVTVKCKKQKDSIEFEPILFEARIVELPWEDPDGASETSFVMEMQTSDAFVRTSNFGRNEKKAYDELLALYDEHRDRLKQSGNDPNAALVKIADWRTRCGLDRKRWPEVQAGLEGRGVIRLDYPHVVVL